MRQLIAFLLFLTLSILSFARAGGGGGGRGGVAAGGVAVGTNSRSFSVTGKRRGFFGGYPFRDGYQYRKRYNDGLGSGLSPYTGFGYPYGYPPSNGYSPNYDSGPQGYVNTSTTPNDPNYGGSIVNDQSIGSISHGSAVVITVGPEGYTSDGVFHGFYVNNASTPSNPNNGDITPNDQNTGNISHGGAAVITVGPEGYTKDGLFHSFHQ